MMFRDARVLRGGGVLSRVLLVVALGFYAQCLASAPSHRVAESAPGNYVSESGACKADLIVSSENSGKDLHVSRVRSSETFMSVLDVNAILWDKDTLYFSVSPVYGRPGIFALKCGETEPRTVARPRNIDQAYPDGADYFQLIELTDSILKFRYARDIDEMKSAESAELRTLKIKRDTRK